MISRACEPKTYSSMALVRSVLEWLVLSLFFQKKLANDACLWDNTVTKGKKKMKKRKSVLDFIGFILGILFLVWAFRVYSSFSPYRAPDETKFYYLQSGNNYRLMALDTDSTLWDLTRKRRPWPHPELVFSCPARPGGICLALIICSGIPGFPSEKLPMIPSPII